MCDKQSRERHKKLYHPSNENTKTVHQNTSKEEERILDSLADCLIVHKIAGNESRLKESEELLDENEVHTLRTAELNEKKNLADDYETIVRKQLQILQADERGKQALQNEIADIKRQQQKRSDALKARKKALMMEKERAKRIASRPPPLPRSVIMLLKEQAKKEAESSAPDEMVNLPQDCVEEDDGNSENKENVLDEKEVEERRKLQEEWDTKAKKRFNEAIKKERQRQENAEILKDIENAEKLNRRQMAKTVSIKGGRVPCFAPDNIFHTAQQVAMEDKVENIFKKNPKEHAVEDLEGYEDYWETKYKQIDSKMEEKMIDCVPSFVKENYAYLLEDESSLRCGRRFSGFDESRDDLNMAYIASPPSNEGFENSEETEAIINHLDQMQKEINETIEKEFKPLLEAKDVPKVKSVDKAIEADILKLPTEHKAVEADILKLPTEHKAVEADILKLPTEHKAVEAHTSSKDKVSVESKSVGVDLMNGGLMGYKRGAFSSRFKTPGDVGSRFASPERVGQDLGKTTGQESWSSSSYWSLPSKHGLPNVCNLCDSPSCNVPLVEHEHSHNSCIPLSRSKETSDSVPGSRINSKEELPSQSNSTSTSNITLTSGNKSKLSYYVQMVADKYLKNPSSKSIEPLNCQAQGIHKEYVREHSDVLQSPKSCSADRIDSLNHKHVWKDSAEPTVHKTSEKSSKQNFISSNPTVASVRSVQTSNYKVSEQNLPKSPEFPAKMSLVINVDESSDVFVQKCHEIISDNLSDIFSRPNKVKTVSAEICYSADNPALEDLAENNKDALSQQLYVYHELSTIQEMDSALTNDGNQSNHNTSKKSLDSNGSVTDKGVKKADYSDHIDTTPVSLVDAPPAEVSELAKGIRFFKKRSPKKADEITCEDPKAPPIFVSRSPSLALTSSSHTLVEAETPSSVTITNSSQFSTLSSLMSNYATQLTVRTVDHSPGSCDVVTPSSQSAHQSPQSIGSQGLPYASSFSSPIKNQHYLTSLASMPKYFQDISSIRHGSSSSSSSQYGGSQSSKTTTDDPNLPLHLTDTGKLSSNEITQKEQVHIDESNPNFFFPMTPHSNLSSPSEAYSKYKSPAMMYGSSEKFWPTAKMSPRNKNTRAALDSPESGSSHFRTLTPHSYSSSQSGLNPREEVILDESRRTRKQNVHEMPPNYPSRTSGHGHQKLQTNENVYNYSIPAENSHDFQPLTPHSYLPGQSEFFPRGRSEFISPDPSELLSLRESEFTSPDPRNSNKFHAKRKKSPADLRLKVLHSVRNSTESNFQSLTPQSGISVSSVKSFVEQNISADVFYPNNPPMYKPVKLRLNFKAQNIRNSDSDSVQYVMGDGSHFQLRIPYQQDIQITGSEPRSSDDIQQKQDNNEDIQKSAKVCSSEFFTPQLYATDFCHLEGIQSTKSLIEDTLQDSEMCTPAQRSKELPLGLRKPIKNTEYLISNSTTKQSPKVLPHKPGQKQMTKEEFIQKSSERKFPKAAKVCNSEFFTPQLSVTDFNQFGGMRSTEGLMEGSVQDSEMCTPVQKSKESSHGLTNPFSQIGSKNTDWKAIMNKECLNPNMTESPKMLPYKPVASTSPTISPNIILEALRKKFMPDATGKLSSQCSTSSKITHQSTPIKTIEEMIQETGILDEPDLTLVNTDFSIKPDSPEKSRHFSENRSGPPITEAVSYYNSTAAKNVVMQSFCDSPSMLSFLQHEMSCISDSKAGASAGPVAQELFKDKCLEQKKIAASPLSAKKTTRNDYKSRTKRLWNNLEEVRKRKLMEEKREQLLRNRLKMKTYSKNFTTPMKKP